MGFGDVLVLEPAPHEVGFAGVHDARLVLLDRGKVSTVAENMKNATSMFDESSPSYCASLIHCECISTSVIGIPA